MKGWILLLLVLGMCTVFSLAHADITTRDPVYRTWIEREIHRCQLRANLINSKGENLRCYGEKAAAQAIFYNHSKHRLVRGMVEASVGLKPYKINYFLVVAYKNHQSGSLLAAR
jgi:hypothetical protein